MSQHPRPIGPTTNAVATFTPSMAQGYQPDRPNRFVRQLGWTASQTTHVAAAFTPDMVDGWTPDRNRERLPLRWSYTHQTPDVDAFSMEMAQGSRPDRPRLFFAPRLPLPLSQTTHVVAFSQEMVKGVTADQSRAWLPTRLGWVFTPPHIDGFSIEMVQGWHPDLPKFSVKSLGWTTAQLTHDAAAFSPEMAQGWRPEAPRPHVTGKVGWSVSQPTHTVAPITLDMFRGWRPDSPQLKRSAPEGWSVTQATFLVQMTPDMFGGWHPDSPRIRLGPRIPLPVSQTTHVNAAFSVEMTLATRPERAQLKRAALEGWSVSQPTFQVQMTPEMFSGWRPDRAVLQLAPKIPLPVSQPTHTNAAITLDMLAGNRPETKRPIFKAGLGWATAQTTFVAQMTPEMFAGHHPDRPRLQLAPKIPLPLSQTTHTNAAFSLEMAQGAAPFRGRLGRVGRQIIGWIERVYEGVIGTPPIKTSYLQATAITSTTIASVNGATQTLGAVSVRSASLTATSTTQATVRATDTTSTTLKGSIDG